MRHNQSRCMDDLELARTVALDPTLDPRESLSRKVHGRAQPNTMTTAVHGRADCGFRKCSSRVVYEETDDGTACPDNGDIYMQA